MSVRLHALLREDRAENPNLTNILKNPYSFGLCVFVFEAKEESGQLLRWMRRCNWCICVYMCMCSSLYYFRATRHTHHHRPFSL